MTLSETIVASFLLLAVLLTVIQLLLSGMRLGGQGDRALSATLLAESVLADVRQWALDPTNFSSSWAEWDGRSVTDPDFPGFTAEVQVEPGGRQLFSPCSTLESQQTDRIELERSVIPVEVRVPWDASHSVRLTTLIDEPERAGARVEVTRAGPADPIPQDGQITLTARLVDASGNPVPGVVFAWSSLARTGNGTLNVTARDGTTSTYRHSFTPLLGPPRFVPGQAEVEARCLYRGRPLNQVVPVVLQ